MPPAAQNLKRLYGRVCETHVKMPLQGVPGQNKRPYFVRVPNKQSNPVKKEKTLDNLIHILYNSQWTAKFADVAQ